MAFKSGKDCKIYLSTEHNTNGFTSTGAIDTASLAVPFLPMLTSSTYAALGDVTGVSTDFSFETIDQSVYGYGTNVRAFPRKRASIEITRNCDGALFRNLNYSASWGVTGSSAAIDDGTGDIRTDSGFRVLYIEGTGTNDAPGNLNDCTIAAHCLLSGYNTSVTPEGITQETITLTSQDWYTPTTTASVFANRAIN